MLASPKKCFIIMRCWWVVNVVLLSIWHYPVDSISNSNRSTVIGSPKRCRLGGNNNAFCHLNQITLVLLFFARYSYHSLFCKLGWQHRCTISERFQKAKWKCFVARHLNVTVLLERNMIARFVKWHNTEGITVVYYLMLRDLLSNY